MDEKLACCSVYNAPTLIRHTFTKEVFIVQGMMALSKTVTYYGPRSAFLYYNPTNGEGHYEDTPYPSRHTDQLSVGLNMNFWCLTPLSAIFQLYHGDQF